MTKPAATFCDEVHEAVTECASWMGGLDGLIVSAARTDRCFSHYRTDGRAHEIIIDQSHIEQVLRLFVADMICKTALHAHYFTLSYLAARRSEGDLGAVLTDHLQLVLSVIPDHLNVLKEDVIEDSRLSRLRQAIISFLVGHEIGHYLAHERPEAVEEIDTALAVKWKDMPFVLFDHRTKVTEWVNADFGRTVGDAISGELIADAVAARTLIRRALSKNEELLPNTSILRNILAFLVCLEWVDTRIAMLADPSTRYRRSTRPSLSMIRLTSLGEYLWSSAEKIVSPVCIDRASIDDHVCELKRSGPEIADTREIQSIILSRWGSQRVGDALPMLVTERKHRLVWFGILKTIDIVEDLCVVELGW